MEKQTTYSSSLSSVAEDLFAELFCDVFGPEKSQYLSIQYPVVDIYGNRRFIDFALENEDIKIAIEIDGERFHNPQKVSSNKYYDDLLKQNSLIFDNWKVYRWVYNQLANQKEMVKDQLVIFLGEMPAFKALEEYLPRQKGKVIELRDHQQSAIDNLQKMRGSGESIALLYHATGAGKTVTAVSDAKRCGERTLFIAHTRELVSQARGVFKDIWPDVQTGLYVAEQKNANSYVVCGSIQMKKYAAQYGWELITPANMKDKFMEMVKTMDMSFSYKPVLLKAMIEHVDESGRVRVEDIVDYFMDYYTDRRNNGRVVEKRSCIYTKEGFTRKEVERNIFANPFKRFEDMRFMKRSREIEYVEFNRYVWKKLTMEDMGWILQHCDEKLGEYYGSVKYSLTKI